MKASALIAGAAALIVGIAASCPARQVTPADVAGPPGAAEADPVSQTCTACHGPAKYASLHQSKAEWAAVVRQMIKYGADVPDGRFDQIVSYLTAHYGPAGQPAPKR